MIKPTYPLPRWQGQMHGSFLRNSFMYQWLPMSARQEGEAGPWQVDQTDGNGQARASCVARWRHAKPLAGWPGWRPVAGGVQERDRSSNPDQAWARRKPCTRTLAVP